MNLTINSCTYGYRPWSNPVVADLDYEMPHGTNILLGPNGAGKSTLLKLAASVIHPRKGTVKFGELSSRERIYRSKVAWMPQRIVAMSTLTAREQVAYVGWLKGMNRRDAWDSSITALSRVDLKKQADTKAARLSGGQLRRVGVASALVHDASVLLLDEPTAGMDPRQRRVFRSLLRPLAEEKDILISTHDVSDLAEESDHVTLLEAGKITFTGSTEDFLAHAPADVAAGRKAEAAYTALNKSEF
ncbi:MULTISPECIES: ATP-binding cassette domain-containing protein [unclassified Streptomyces]|uniref:ATP-binding cassette domain-containing protein n=1 Tax=unclassified Streptomyces TaxID=2593676 RepID=UPI00381B5539